MKRPVRGYYLASVGRTEEALEILREVERRWPSGELTGATVAMVHVGLGNREEALRYLELDADNLPLRITFSRPDMGWTNIMLKADPIWDPIREDPRFEAVLRKMGF